MLASLRRVVRSAIRFPNGEIICSGRHFDRTMIRKSHKAGYSLHQAYQAEQGFTDQNYVFMSKKEAMLVAEASGQYKRKVGSRKTMLLSSDLHGNHIEN